MLIKKDAIVIKEGEIVMEMKSMADFIKEVREFNLKRLKGREDKQFVHTRVREGARRA